MLRNLTIAPKLGILVGATLLGLCVTGVLASYLMQQEMLSARIDQTKAIVTIAKNMAGELKTAGRRRRNDQGAGHGACCASSATR